jgi:hypothetical protein
MDCHVEQGEHRSWFGIRNDLDDRSGKSGTDRFHP